MDIYRLALSKADEIENELKRLGRWSQNPLPDAAFNDMGAFGSNTMSFEQWLQFVLNPRIRQIVEEQGDFPEESNLATYAIRYFDGDPDANGLWKLLDQLDHLINQNQESANSLTEAPISNPVTPTVTMGDTTIPEVLFSVAEVIPQFELEAIESQLQTFDTFLSFLSPTVRPAISALLRKAAIRCTNPDCKKRLEQAANDIADGKRAAALYNHDEAMKKFQEDHRKNFPPQST